MKKLHPLHQLLIEMTSKTSWRIVSRETTRTGLGYVFISLEENLPNYQVARSSFETIRVANRPHL